MSLVGLRLLLLWPCTDLPLLGLDGLGLLLLMLLLMLLLLLLLL